MGKVCTERIAFYADKGHKHRLFKTKRAPTRYYYRNNGKRIYIDEKLVDKTTSNIITTD